MEFLDEGKRQVWTTLEIAKLTVSAFTPLAVAAVAFQVTKATKRLEARQWMNQKLIEKRIALLSEALSDLNDLHCYFAWVGNWKELSPRDILHRKRSLDRLFYANRPFFQSMTIEAYGNYSGELFKTYSAPGRNAKLRTAAASRHGKRSEAYGDGWDPQWNAYFVSEVDRTEPERLAAAYDVLLRQFAAEVGQSDTRGDGAT
ncbi:hypothetical protein [Verrucosispora sp. WMMC514]|uniref:hypothetical protein n=1 Tax=Verrucosispora sp. WMMC514 TaxID=3015156 RepID=UPI00248AC7ED|nr:hypothetical protein [Verrucosispora sp. WMMC514]WBB91427.1 hypothetical protein O7597_31470 [Verrucosispora sp. WMMC514]